MPPGAPPQDYDAILKEQPSHLRAALRKGQVLQALKKPEVSALVAPWPRAGIRAQAEAHRVAAAARSHARPPLCPARRAGGAGRVGRRPGGLRLQRRPRGRL
jgi:hypothetical protein